MKRLLVTVDSLRRDHFAYMPETQSFLDRTHDRTFATFTATLGSFQSILGGEYPTSGHLTDCESVVSEFDTHSVGITTNRLLSERYGYSKGFDTFHSPHTGNDDSLKDRVGALLPSDTPIYRLAVKTLNAYQSIVAPVSNVEKSFRPAPEVIDDFLVEFPKDEDWFGWLHFMEPHHPYDPEEGPVSRSRAQRVSRRVIAGAGDESDFELVPELYRAEIEELDEQLARLWEAIPDETRVVFSADHGEFLGEAGLWGHPNELRPEILNVPFGMKNCPEVGDVVSLIDVPTILLDEQFGEGTLDREIAYASVAQKKAAMTTEHLATADGVTTFDGESVENPQLERALERFDPEHVEKEDADESDLEALGYL